MSKRDGRDLMKCLEIAVLKAKDSSTLYDDAYDMFTKHCGFDSTYKALGKYLRSLMNNGDEPDDPRYDGFLDYFKKHPNMKGQFYRYLIIRLLCSFSHGCKKGKVKKILFEYAISSIHAEEIIQKFIDLDLVREETSTSPKGKMVVRYYLNGIYGEFFSKSVDRDNVAFMHTYYENLKKHMMSGGRIFVGPLPTIKSPLDRYTYFLVTMR